MTSVFAMSTGPMLDEAAEWLHDLGFLTAAVGTGDRHRLAVHHDADTAREVRRVVEIVDPAAARVR